MTATDHPVAEDLGWHGAWRFTRQSSVEPELTARFHELYEAAFGPLRTRSMARQTLSEGEFEQQMSDRGVLKVVAWDDDDEPVGMCAMTDRLATVPWISPEYFAHHYPDHWARNAVWYFSFILAHPSQRHHRFVDQMMEVVIGPLADLGAVCAYDMCAFNDEVLHLGRRLSEAFERTTGVEPRLRDAQNYYVIEFG